MHDAMHEMIDTLHASEIDCAYTFVPLVHEQKDSVEPGHRKAYGGAGDSG